MVARIIERKNGCEFLPASKVKPKNGELVWLLDRPAANGLTNPNSK
jgi:hypothetical protein